jgi:hypothetical protein
MESHVPKAGLPDRSRFLVVLGRMGNSFWNRIYKAESTEYENVVSVSRFVGRMKYPGGIFQPLFKSLQVPFRPPEMMRQFMDNSHPDLVS